MDRQTEGWMEGRKDGQMDGQTEKPYFIGPFWLWPGVQQKEIR